ncbi:MAG: phenylalanine--tRNA ligase subunit beta [Phycisphaerae bacterium]|nr:phenylalanine--tRNA ligase subunit beta [Phycisphaerae bacterium]
MHISLRWLCEYLEPAQLSADRAESVLTHAGFPIESRTPLPDGDTMLDVEVTSNRGDCLSHVGLAREIAAKTELHLKEPSIPATIGGGGVSAPDVSGAVSLDNRVPAQCPIFTARVLTGVKVGPSPDWLVRALASVGQRSINNIVDVTNYLTFELGQPAHVFDLAAIPRGADGRRAIVVRAAEKGERLALLDGRQVDLRPGEVVVCDTDRSVSLAGIMGGLDTAVSDRTTDILLEAATWDPSSVRATARRLQVRTDASHRFERVVDPRTVEPASRRAADLILRVSPGARALSGVLTAGLPLVEATTLRLRPARCRDLLGVALSAEDMARALTDQGFGVTTDSSSYHVQGRLIKDEPALLCRVPFHRPDVRREIDLVEEVARTVGLDRIEIKPRLSVTVPAPQATERAARELGGILTGLGFFETVTFSFVSPKHAAPFLVPGTKRLDVQDQRRAAEPTLRPSILPGLLVCRKANQDGRVSTPGGVRLYELASVFSEPAASGAAQETRRLALLADAQEQGGSDLGYERAQSGLRLVRGAIESLVAALRGRGVPLGIEPAAAPCAAFDPATTARVTLWGALLGHLGLLSKSVQALYDLDAPVVVAEVDLPPLLASYPPPTRVEPLPQFPAIERDLSIIVPEVTTWAAILARIDAAALAMLERVAFVGVYRGKQIGAGRKSVTFRLTFRDPSATLRDEHATQQVEALVARLAGELGATLRA